jgi:hypothetical protein
MAVKLAFSHDDDFLVAVVETKPYSLCFCQDIIGKSKVMKTILLSVFWTLKRARFYRDLIATQTT